MTPTPTIAARLYQHFMTVVKKWDAKATHLLIEAVAPELLPRYEAQMKKVKS